MIISPLHPSMLRRPISGFLLPFFGHSLTGSVFGYISGVRACPAPHHHLVISGQQPKIKSNGQRYSTIHLFFTPANFCYPAVMSAEISLVAPDLYVIGPLTGGARASPGVLMSMDDCLLLRPPVSSLFKALENGASSYFPSRLTLINIKSMPQILTNQPQRSGRT